MHHTLSEHMAELVQNAVEAGAALVMVDLVERGTEWMLYVADNGKGMDEATLARVFDPFCTEPGKHPRRRVGLGLPFLRQAVEQAGGEVDVKSRPGEGTSVYVRLPADHVDAPPLGDWAGTVVGLMALDGGHELAFRHERNGAGYSVGRGELIEALGGLDDAEGLALARRYVATREARLAAESAPTDETILDVQTTIKERTI